MTYANSAALVSTDWVAEHLNDPHVQLMEVDVDTTAYERGHICCSVGVNWTTQLGDPIRRDIVQPEAWARLMSEAGMSLDTLIVFYGDNNNWFAAFAYWIARMYGHPRAALMNGGRKKWELEGRELITDVAEIRHSSYPVPQPDQRLRALLPDVLHMASTSNGGVLVDVRSPAEFNGEIIAPPGMTETAQRAGHIPGAQSIPWLQAANEDGTFRTADELLALYTGKGVTADRDVITYCRIGERSSHTWFVLSELLGYPNVRNYDGSWTEYGSAIGVPIDNPAAKARVS